jgi:GTP-binding protein Era
MKKSSNKKAVSGPRRSGFVVILGRPNVGKSTLLNQLVGEKIAGVSPKPQTTRHSIRGIVSRPEGQILFLDTPGLHDARDPLGNWMMKQAQQSLEDADLIYWMVLPEAIHPYDEKILETLKSISKPIILLINQVDRYPKPHVLPVLDHYHKAFSFKEIIPISAREGIQTDVLLQKTFENLPEAQPYFPEDQISDQNERFIVSELIREKIFRFTSQEVPYATAVLIDSFKDRSERLIDIEATVIVERDSQKAILIGKKGEMMKEIGQAARADIERFLGKKVFLQLWVKTMEGWKEDKSSLRSLGYE